MALPDQSRGQFTTRPLDTPESQKNFLGHLQERFDRLPIFPKQFNDTAAPATSTVSGSMTAIAGSPTWTIYKEESWTVLDVSQVSAGRVDTLNVPMYFGIMLDGVGYANCFLFVNVNLVGHHQAVPGLDQISGIAAGKHTIQIGYAVGGGATLNVDSNDYFAVTIQEGIPPRTS